MSGDPDDLRKRAKRKLKEQPQAVRGVHDERKLLHELEVHQVELELQNEELRAARNDSEAALERATELFEFAPIGYATVDPLGEIIDINHVGAEILGVGRGQLIRRSFRDRLEVSDRPAFTRLLTHAVSAISRTSLELQLHRGETLVYLRLKVTALARVEPTLLLAFEDVTERRQGERKLAETDAALVAAARQKDDFLAALSHELRNPLTPIRNSLVVLEHAGSDAAQLQKARTIIERQVNHLSRLIDDLLDVTRIGRGKITLQSESVDLTELVSRVLDDHELAFEQARVTLEGQLPAGHLFVDGDPARLTQVVSNLLGNAEKFSPPGTTVLVTLREVAGEAVLSVKDQGVGIDPELLPRLFESFVQGPQPFERPRGGLGLGLAMVKGLVELQGGTAAARSAGLGKGSEFTVKLKTRAPPAHSSAPKKAPGPPRTHRVLIIEDNVDTCESMRDLIALGGHTVEIAFDGRQGLQVAEQFEPEIVFCDIGLPGMTGYEVARSFRASPRLSHVYLVALTGYARPEDQALAEAAGFDRHMAKPPRIDELEQLLASDELSSGGTEAQDPAPRH